MIHVALRAAGSRLRAEDRLVCLNRVGKDGGVIGIGESDVGYGIYVDNLIVVGSDKDRVASVHSRAVAGLGAANLRCSPDSIAGPQRRVDYVGLELRGDTREVAPKGTRAQELALALRYLVSCGRWHADALERAVGVLAWVFCLRRPLFVLLGAVYQFVRQHRGTWAVAWPSARREVLAAARLLPLAVVSLARPWAPLELAQDAEGPNRTDHGGAGVVGRVLGGGSLPDPAGPPACGLEPGVWGTAEEVWVERGGKWRPLLHRRWRYSEHINLGELQSVVLWLQRVARSEAWHGCRVLVWTDSGVALGVLRKGRARSFSLGGRYRKLAALLLVADLELDVRWLPTHLQPADALSRLGCWLAPASA